MKFSMHGIALGEIECIVRLRNVIRIAKALVKQLCRDTGKSIPLELTDTKLIFLATLRTLFGML